MAFDPSIISAIPDMAPNPVKAEKEALTIKDMMDRTQLGSLQLGEEQARVKESGQVQDILKKSDYSTPQGLAKTAAAVNRVSPRSAMDLMKTGQAYQSGQIQQQLDQLTLAEKRQDLIVNAIDPIVAQARAMKNSGASDLAVKAYISQQMPTALQNLRGMKLDDGKPALPDDVLKMATSVPYDLATLEGWESKSKAGAAAIKQRKEQFTADTQAKRAETDERRLDETERHNRATESRPAGGAKAPAGFEWDPDKPDTLRPIKGGPKDPEGSAMSGRQAVMFTRVVSSANEAAAAIKNITELPIGASSGVFGVGGGPGHGLFSSAKSALTNEVASQDIQDYNSMLAGVKRNLATIESAGLAPSGALTENFASLELRAGDTSMTKLRKLAEMRQIVEKGLEVNLDDPHVPPPQKDLIRKIIKQVTDSVPYTQSDITMLQRAQRKNPELTLEQLIGKQGLRPESPAGADGKQPASPGSEPKPPAEGATPKAGNVYKHSSGATVEILEN